MFCYSNSDIQKMEKVFRLNLINCIGGFKSANLIGTQNGSGQTNLAVFSSVTHIGSNPPLLGMITRPTDEVPRHTYQNIKDSGYYTINHIHSAITDKAHATSAKFDASISEFDACKLTPEYIDDFPAPFVQESRVKIGMRFKEEYHIKANGTIHVIGEIMAIYLPDGSVAEDGWINLNALDTATISGLNAYHKAEQIQRYAYARPQQPIQIIE